jgi:DinB superfamily
MFDGDGVAPGPGPTGTWTDAADALAQFEQSMQALLEQTQANEAQFRAGVFEHSAFGPMDGVQWLLFAAVHTNSHLSEIKQFGDIAGRTA